MVYRSDDSIIMGRCLEQPYYPNISPETYNQNTNKRLTCIHFQSFHAELHQYKYHVDLFNQLTQKLIAVYPSDDTSRIKRMTEAVNMR